VPVSLTTHVLDLTSGRPAAGMGFVLTRFGRGDGPIVVTGGETNADGRTDEPLLATDALTPGRYELTFAVGTWFASRHGDPIGASADAERYLDEVPIRFGVAPGTEHLHVALLVTPWSYTTYRGS
jgi:5-hydroxyisourate hydrolase